MSDEKECAICVNKFNKIRKPITCASCNAVACNYCTKTFLLTNTVQAKCMACQSAWNMEFIRTALSKSFMDGEYRKHQVSTILSEAETRVGELQPLVPIKRMIDQIQEQIQEKTIARKQIETSITTFNNELSSIFTNIYPKSKEERDIMNKQICDIRAAIKQKKEERFNCRVELAMLNHQRQQHMQMMGTTTVVGPRAEFFMACPAKDCRGRLSTVYKCGLCEHWFCPDCHGDKGHDRHTPHECNKDDKDTVTLLKQNTKPCPKCHEGIFKVSGCDQMWCTRCHTCFSWHSNKILNGTIHNPHYYAYQRQQNGGEAPRVPGDIPCGGFPPFHAVRSKFRMRHADDSDFVQYLSRAHRLMVHVIDVCLPVLRRAMEENRELGIEYLCGNISRDEWGQKLYLASRKRERKQRIQQVLDMVTMACGDIFRNWINSDMNDDDIIGAIVELITYANEQIDIQNKQYGTKLRYLDPMSDAQYIVHAHT